MRHNCTWCAAAAMYTTERRYRDDGGLNFVVRMCADCLATADAIANGKKTDDDKRFAKFLDSRKNLSGKR